MVDCWEKEMLGIYLIIIFRAKWIFWRVPFIRRIKIMSRWLRMGAHRIGQEVLVSQGWKHVRGDVV